MLPYAVLADIAGRSYLDDVAYSARPDAPVLPEPTRARRFANAAASVRHGGRTLVRRRAVGPVAPANALPLLADSREG